MEGSNRSSKGRTILTAWAEPAADPGWSNRPLWVLCSDDSNGALTLECIQPEDQTSDMALLYNVSAAVSRAMGAAAENMDRAKTMRKGS